MTDYDIQLKAGARRPLEEAISEVHRELGVRERCYKRWIDDGKLSKTDAKDRIDRLESALQHLKYFQDWIAADDARQKNITLIDPAQAASSNTPPATGAVLSDTPLNGGVDSAVHE